MGYSVESRYTGKVSLDSKLCLHFGGYRTSSVKEARVVDFPEGKYGVFETMSGNFHRVAVDVLRRELSFKAISVLVERFPSFASI